MSCLFWRWVTTEGSSTHISAVDRWCWLTCFPSWCWDPFFRCRWWHGSTKVLICIDWSKKNNWNSPCRELTYPSPKACLKMIFFFPRWDMLVSGRVRSTNFLKHYSKQLYPSLRSPKRSSIEKGAVGWCFCVLFGPRSRVFYLSGQIIATSHERFSPKLWFSKGNLLISGKSRLVKYYNSLGVELDEQDEELVQTFHGKRMLYSQKGVMTGFVRKDDLELTRPVDVSIMSWKPKTSKRIVESSFAAETHGALLGHGAGHYLRPLYCEIRFGAWVIKSGDEVEWDQLTPLVLCTDCKSIYDCMSKDGHTIGDRTNALNVAVLRQLLTTNRKPSGEKAHLLWVPTRHQAADGLTKSGRHLDMQRMLCESQVTFHGLSAKHMQRSKRVAPVRKLHHFDEKLVDVFQVSLSGLLRRIFGTHATFVNSFVSFQDQLDTTAAGWVKGPFAEQSSQVKYYNLARSMFGKAL